jgi:hypothetical protein
MSRLLVFSTSQDLSYAGRRRPDLSSLPKTKHQLPALLTFVPVYVVDLGFNHRDQRKRSKMLGLRAISSQAARTCGTALFGIPRDLSTTQLLNMLL